MDTAKVSNLFLCHPDNDFLDFVNAPIGKGIHISKKLKPLICGENYLDVHVFNFKVISNLQSMYCLNSDNERP